MPSAEEILAEERKSRSGPLYHLSHGQREPDGFKSCEREKPAGSLYHLSHGQREPVGFRSLSLPEQNATLFAESP